MKKLIYIFLLAVGQMSAAHAQLISTMAGNGVYTTPPTGDGGAATAATVAPNRITIDNRGNIYFGDQYERKIDRKGIITDLAGGGSLMGVGDGGPATAVIVSPDGDATDADGNVYIIDLSKTAGLVRMVDKEGIIHTYAGGGTAYPYDGGPATAADLRFGMRGLHMDAAKNLYIAGSTIKKVDAAGIITTIGGVGTTDWYAGDGIPATAASFFATCIVTDRSGNLYFTDADNNMLRKINIAGIISTVAGDGSPTGGYSGDGGPATAARLDQPIGLAIDTAGNLYLSDTYNNRIRRIAAKTGIITTIAGDGTGAYNGDGRLASTAELKTPNGITIDCGNNIYISDGNARIRKVTYTAYMDFVSEGSSITVCANSGTAGVDSMLQVSDTAHGQAVDWVVYAGAMHGTVSGSYSAVANGGTLTPTGFTYTPAPGYSGADSFTILVGPCAQVGDLRTIHVTVDQPAVAAISGIATDHVVCLGKTVSLTDATTGGTWSVSGTAVTLTGATIKGVTAGTATVSYSLTDGIGCSNAATSAVTVKDCPEGVASPRPSAKEREVYPNPVTNELHITNITGTVSYRLLSIVGSVLRYGTLGNGGNVVNMANVASGIYILELADPATGLRQTSKVIKQ